MTDDGGAGGGAWPWYSIPWDDSGGVGQDAFPSPPVTIAAGVLAQIAYPANVPPQTELHYCVILNASPFTIVVSSGRVMTQIAAFTADVVQVVVTQRQPIVVLPVAGVGLVQTGTDSTVYATWLAEAPGGVYPSAIGAGTTPTNQSALVADETIALGAGPFLITPTMQPWMQAVGLRFLQSGGTAEGLLVTVYDAVNGITDAYAQSVLGFTQWFYAPVQGNDVIVRVAPMLAGNPGGTVSGELKVYGLAGPIAVQRLATQPAVLYKGLQASGNCAGGGGTLTLIGRPGVGSMIRVRNVSYTMAVAPAAGATLILRGSVSLGAYFAWIPPAAIGGDDIGGEGFYLGSSGQADQSEGLAVLNNTTQAAALRVAYDILPIPWGSADA